ncbi:Aldo-keto reductase family 1 member C1-like protein, partial [Heterocephalus glaber]
KSKTAEATRLAIDAGFHGKDSAYLHQNKEGVGVGIQRKIADGPMKREDIFYTAKVECHPYVSQSRLLDFCESEHTVLVA